MKSNIKKGLKNFTGAVIFLVIFAALIELASFALIPKENGRKGGMEFYSSKGYTSEPDDSLDVIFLGNSNCYTAVSPMEIWNSYGITSYNCGAPLLRMSDLYYDLIDVLKYQHPSIVFVETDSFFSVGTELSDLENTLESAYNYVFPTLEYHDRWKELKLSELFEEPQYTTHISEKGYVFSNGVLPYTGNADYMAETDTPIDIPATALLYFDNISNLCAENGIQLVLLGVPSPNSWNYAKHMAVNELAAEYEVPYIDLNLNYQALGVNLATDTRDGGNHFNHSGAVKLSAYIGEFLNNNFTLADHRSDSSYAQWNTDYQIYEKDVSSNIQSDINIETNE